MKDDAEKPRAEAPFPDILVTIEDARRSIGHVSKNRVYDYIRNGMLEAVQIGRRTFVTGDSLRALPSKFPAKKLPPKGGR